MGKRLAIAAMVVVTIVAVVFAWHERNRAMQLTEARDAKPPTGECQRSDLAELSKAVSTAFSAKRSPAKPAPGGSKKISGDSIDDLPADVQVQLFDATDALHAQTSKDFAEILAKLRISSEQERALHERIDQMNKRIGGSLDKLLALTTQTEPISPRAAIDALAEGLNAIRETDDGFLATLDDAQRQQLKQDNFDMTSQVDPMLFVTRAFALAAAFPSSKDSSDGSADGPAPQERRADNNVTGRSVKLSTSMSVREN